MVGVALRVAAIPSVVLVRRSFVGSVVSATISSVVVVSVARIHSVVVVSVARISTVVVVSVAQICVAWIYVARIYVAQIYVARGLCRCSLIDGRFEVEVWTKSRRYSCRREQRARSWCVETARCCKVRGELIKSLVHLLDAALLYTLARADVPHYIVHVSIGLFGGQLYLPHTLGEVFELPFPALDDDVQVVGCYHAGRSGIFHTWIVLPEDNLFILAVSLLACESWKVSTSLILSYYLIQ